MARTLTDDQVEAALYAICDTVARRRLENRPIPQEVIALQRVLSIASECGTETECSSKESEHDLISSDEAAEILCCTARRVTQIATDLDGRKIGGRWVFPRGPVLEYADEVARTRRRTIPPRAG